MQCKNENELTKLLKEQPLQGVYLLYGSESFLIETYTKKIASRFGGGFGSFNLQKLDGQKLDCDLLLDAVETLPLMASEKCVVLDNLTLTKLPDSEIEKLLEIVSDIPLGCVLVIAAKSPGFDLKSAAAKKLIKACAKEGCVAELSARDVAGLVSFIKEIAKKNQCELPTDIAKYILATCETDMANLKNEVAKICAHAGYGEIGREDVDAVAVARTEARVFDLSKAITAKNTQRAMEILRDLFYLREQPVAILSVLSMAYTDLYRARVAKENGYTPADVVAKFGYKGREFRVNNAWNSRLTLPELRAAMQNLLDCDRRMKSTPVDPKILLEQAVVGLFASGGSAWKS